MTSRTTWSIFGWPDDAAVYSAAGIMAITASSMSAEPLPSRGEADGRGALARRVHRARRDLLGVLEELALGGARVAEQQHVDVAADAVLVVDVLRHAAKERERDGHLGRAAAVQARRERAHDVRPVDARRELRASVQWGS